MSFLATGHHRHTYLCNELYGDITVCYILQRGV